jgi:hypothetical protein
LPFGEIVDIGVASKIIEGKKKEGVELFVTTDTGQKIYFSKNERKNVENFVKTDLRPQLQQKIDDTIYDLFNIPDDIRLIVDEFVKYRLPLDKSTVPLSITRPPDKEELLAYAIQLRAELDGFLRGKAYHKITITKSNELIVCEIEATNKGEIVPITMDSIEDADLTITEFFADISDSLRKQVSQWIYVQRGLRLFDGLRIFLCKAPRLIDWTRTQAIHDAGDIISKHVSEGMKA